MTALANMLSGEIRAGEYQGMAALDAWTYEDLKRDIQENGVEVPIVVDQDFVIVDGHHRWQIACELGIQDTVPVEVHTYGSPSKTQAAAVRLNVNRRQLDKTQRNAYVVKLRELGLTQAEVADRVGLSRNRISEIEDKDVSESDTSSSEERPPKKRGNKYATKADSEKVQAKVAEMVAAGASTREIADELDISVSAVWQRKKQLPANPDEPTPLHEQIAECAARGMTSVQIAAEVGHGQEWVREQARRHDITIPADKSSYKKHIDATAAMTRAVGHLGDAVYAFNFIPLNDLDAEQTDEWSRSLDEVAKSIRTLIRQLNQLTKEQDQS